MENINQEPFITSDLRETVPDELSLNYSPNNPPWNILVAFGLFILSLLLIAIIQILVITPYLASQKIAFTDEKVFTDFVTTDPTALFLQIASVIPAHLLTLLVAWLIVTRFKTYSFKEMLGWHWGGYKWWEIGLYTVGLLVSVFAMAGIMTWIFGEKENDFEKILNSSRAVVLLVAFMATFSAPLVEEIVFRGVLYSAFQRTFSTPISQTLKIFLRIPLFNNLYLKLRNIQFLQSLTFGIESIQKNFGVAIAIIVISVMFAGVHYVQYWGDLATIITITFLSLILTLIRWKTDSILPCIFFHFVVNGVQSAALVFYPYLEPYLNK